MEPMESATTLERALLQQASQKRAPINGSLELLPLCNMNCDMCYVRLSREEMEQQGGRLRTVDEWLSVAREMQKAGVLFLLLTGGEPLIYPEFRRLYVELKKMGFILTINTNGTLIDEETAAFFRVHKPRRINITLYGCDDQAYQELCHYPGGFEKTVRGIRLLRESGVDVKVSGSITKANEQDVERLLAIGQELDVPVRMDTYMMPAVRERQQPYDLQSRLDPVRAARARVKALKGEMGEELFAAYVRENLRQIDEGEPGEELSKRMSCYAGSCSFTINWQGLMRPCVVMSGPSASVFELGFSGAWAYLKEELEKIFLSPKCSGCRIRGLCRTCAASALLEEGSYDAVPHYMCSYTEETVRLLRLEQGGESHG